MALIPYNPFRDIEKFFEDWAERFEAFSFPEISLIEEPKMDIYEKGEKLIAEIAMPGVDPKSIDVSVEDNVLRVEAKKEEKVEEKKKNYYRKEIKGGYLKRMIALPVEVLGEKAQATYQNGVLKIEIPKKEEKKKKAKKVPVKVLK
ncbi:MAG: Hsp20/alpha crystallin family protein [Candidatus Pacebacteria bacterium]|nr:Hsp20/alpha crystallin family protein [Candidatus Paceibacterota bacterium]